MSAILVCAKQLIWIIVNHLCSSAIHWLRFSIDCCPSFLFVTQVWSVALKQDSTLLMPATLAKLPVEEAASVSQLCSLLLLQHAHYLDAPTAATVSRLMLAVLLHYAAPVRRAGFKAVKQCVAEKPKLAGVYSSTASS